MLTAVFVRHKPVGTKQYIREQLRPYADKQHFAFTKGGGSPHPVRPARTLPGAAREDQPSRFLKSSLITQPDPSLHTDFVIPEKRRIRRFRINSKRSKKDARAPQ